MFKKFGKLIKFLARIMTYVILCLLFLITIFLTYYMINSFIAKRNNTYPSISLYTIVSPSMEPFINVYDVILNKKVGENEELKVGDVITFYSSSINTDGYTITHRIHDIKEIDGVSYYVTKGDNNQSVDIGTITRDEIVGKMIFKFNGLGKIQFFLASKTGWLLIILLPALCFILYDLKKIENIFRIKNKLDNIPEYKDTKELEEIEHNKKVRALIEKGKWFK